MKPTDEQVKEFWEGLGFFKITANMLRKKPMSEFEEMAWHNPDGSARHSLPPIDLNNLFRFAVTKLQNTMAKVEFDGFIQRWVNNFWGLLPIQDPALALFWVLYPIITGKEVIHG